ncbi:alpha/beta fold hydrolase [Streptomyces flavofungini]|uniref:alpha/beta fold hydrolase n=1 Tax=Streptomyces flavofungini TaxID=68200 RepID=UPI0025B204F2|nr:alpha/beta hydrolase [Streptomyces flavofungini]WJV47399.1 alpha/beta hydrolase [Streptomyces flavofungini]
MAAGVGTKTRTTRATYARTTAGEGPALLLAHGAGGSVEANFGPVLPALAATHRAVAVDYPGSGKTPRAKEPLTLDTLADELIAAADAEGADTFALAGYSLGTAVAVRTAARHPDRVKALVLTAPFARPDTRMTLAAQVWHHLASSRDRDELARFLLPLALSPEVLDALPPDQLAATLRGTAESVPEGTPDHVDLVLRTDVRADLAAVTAPTLVITTTRDQLVPPRVQREVAAGIRGARVAGMDTGHLPFAERPAQWQRLITDFLAETETGTRTASGAPTGSRPTDRPTE